MIEYVGPTTAPARVAFLPGDPWRLAAVNHQAVYLWDAGRPNPQVTWPTSGPADWRARLAGSSNGRWLALVAGRLTLHDLQAGPTVPAVPIDGDRVLAARFAGNPERLLVVRAVPGEGHPAVGFQSWKMPAERAVRPARASAAVLPGPPNPLPDTGPGWDSKDLSADGGRFALSHREKALHVWNTSAGTFIGTLRLRGLPCGLAFAPDGSKFVLDAGTTLYVHCTDTLELITKWKANYCYTPGLAWSPDGRLLARTDNSTTIRLYDVGSGQQVAALGTKRGRYTSVAFAPDGLTFAAGAADGTVRVWDVS